MNPIETFYKDSTVLITGSTGFIGATLVEKLLRCFEVKKMFLLVRIKSGMSVKERHEHFLNLQIFDLLRKENSSLFKKLVPVEVDYGSSDLNIESKVLEEILDEVQVNFVGFRLLMTALK